MTVLHTPRPRVGRPRWLVLSMLVILGLSALLSAQTPSSPPNPPVAADPSVQVPSPDVSEDVRSGLMLAVVRLPFAALLGAALALRPRRHGYKPRDPAVIETQIVLAIVGALIMLIIGASLARAFGIAGAANLIRYRAKIEDPKDAVVMLSTLSVGLAAGVGLFGIATIGTLFLAVTLWIIEGFDVRTRTFLLTVKLGERTSHHRAAVERLLKKARTVFELRVTSDEELAYLVSVGNTVTTERLSAALAALAKDGKAQIEWKEEKKAQPVDREEAE